MNKWLQKSILAMALLGALSGFARAEGSKFRFNLHATARPVPEIMFNDANGVARTLDDYSGKYVLLNVWATWCPPCRKELPDLQALHQQLGGDDFQVIALSTDTGRLQNVRKLYDELGMEQAEIFIDETGSAMRKLGIFAMPATLLIDPEGQEVGRKLGPADWGSTSAVDFFRTQIAAE